MNWTQLLTWTSVPTQPLTGRSRCWTGAAVWCCRLGSAVIAVARRPIPSLLELLRELGHRGPRRRPAAAPLFNPSLLLSQLWLRSPCRQSPLDSPRPRLGSQRRRQPRLGIGLQAPPLRSVSCPALERDGIGYTDCQAGLARAQCSLPTHTPSTLHPAHPHHPHTVQRAKLDP